MERYEMKAKETFRGANGYIVAGQDFFTLDKNSAAFYARNGVAEFKDEELNNQIKQFGDLKELAQVRLQSDSQSYYSKSQLERNVTKLAQPVNIKLLVNGVDPEDVNVEVTRGDQKVQSQGYQTQNNQGGQNQQVQNQNYQEQSQNQSYQTQNTQQDNTKNVQVAGQNQNENVNVNNNNSVNNNQNQESPVYEVRHVGGGYYDLPTGERVRGREQAEARMNEIIASGEVQNQGQNEGQAQGQQQEQNQQVQQGQAQNQQVQQGQNQAQGNQQEQGQSTRQVGQTQFPNPQRVQQTNVEPQDGKDLYANQNVENEGLTGAYVDAGSFEIQGGEQVVPAPNAEGVNREADSGEFTDSGVARTAGATGASGVTGGTTGTTGAAGTTGTTGNTNQ